MCLRNRLDVLQRRMVRFILSKEARDHVGSGEFRHLSWLSIPDRVSYSKLVQVSKIRLGKSPPYLSKNIFRITGRHSHNTRRSSHDYFVSKDLAFSSASFAYTAVRHWNDLPSPLKADCSVGTFKSRLKENMLHSY